MAKQAALEAFQQKLADEKAAAAAATAAYQAKLEKQAALEAFQQKLADEKAAAAAATAAYKAKLEAAAAELERIALLEAAHEACKYALNLSDSNIKLFEEGLATGNLFNIGPQVTNGTEFGSSRWDAYANCVDNYVNPF